MKLKPCSCCKKDLTTKDVCRVIRFKDSGIDSLYFNCKTCNSTMVVLSKKSRAIVYGKAA